jgi:hypothetical protein
MIACLLCLLGKGANPLLKADISLKALLSNDDSQECTHSELSPLELAQQVPQNFISNWPRERIIGWRIFCVILGLSQQEWDPTVSDEPEANEPEASELGEELGRSYGIYSRIIGEPSPGSGFQSMGADLEDENRNADTDDSESSNSDNEYSDDDKGVPAYCLYHNGTSYQENFFGKNKYLATLWAAVQTELLTYRRLNENDPWISANFDMESVLESLETGTDLTINLVFKKMMREFCRCGIFIDSVDPLCANVEEASAYYFSNLEDWNRSTFLDPLDRDDYRDYQDSEERWQISQF